MSSLLFLILALLLGIVVMGWFLTIAWLNKNI